MEDESILPALVMKGRYSLRSFMEREKHIRRDTYFFTKKHKPKHSCASMQTSKPGLPFSK